MLFQVGNFTSGIYQNLFPEFALGSGWMVLWNVTYWISPLLTVGIFKLRTVIPPMKDMDDEFVHKYRIKLYVGIGITFAFFEFLFTRWWFLLYTLSALSLTAAVVTILINDKKFNTWVLSLVPLMIYLYINVWDPPVTWHAIINWGFHAVHVVVGLYALSSRKRLRWDWILPFGVLSSTYAIWLHYTNPSYLGSDVVELVLFTLVGLCLLTIITAVRSKEDISVIAADTCSPDDSTLDHPSTEIPHIGEKAIISC